MDPCGTPHLLYKKFEEISLYTTYCFLLDK